MAKKQDYTQLAKEVVEAVGGKENIISVTIGAYKNINTKAK